MVARMLVVAVRRLSNSVVVDRVMLYAWNVATMVSWEFVRMLQDGC